MRSIYMKQTRHRYTVNFDAATEESMREILDSLCRRHRITDRPSVALIVACIVREFASSMQHDPASALKGLMNEIKARGGPVGKYREQVATDETASTH